jgi:hypothetical protein
MVYIIALYFWFLLVYKIRLIVSFFTGFQLGEGELGQRVHCSASVTPGDLIVVITLEEFDKTLVEDIKEEWRQLWLWRIDDKVRAEGVSSRSFPLCSVERGTVIVATKDFKPLDLKEILNSHKIQNVERVVGPHPSVGGWRKFARTVLTNQARSSTRLRRLALEKPCRDKKNLQLKKGGRGWMHRT